VAIKIVVPGMVGYYSIVEELIIRCDVPFIQSPDIEGNILLLDSEYKSRLGSILAYLKEKGFKDAHVWSVWRDFPPFCWLR